MYAYLGGRAFNDYSEVFASFNIIIISNIWLFIASTLIIMVSCIF